MCIDYKISYDYFNVGDLFIRTIFVLIKNQFGCKQGQELFLSSAKIILLLLLISSLDF